MWRRRLERRPAGQHLVDDDSERIQISAAVDFLACGEKAELLGRRIAQLADKDSGARRCVVALIHLRDAEVDELDALVGLFAARDHQVLGADVAMDDARPVDGIDPADGFEKDVLDLVDLAHAAGAEALDDPILSVDGFVRISSEEVCYGLATMWAGLEGTFDFSVTSDTAKWHAETNDTT